MFTKRPLIGNGRLRQVVAMRDLTARDKDNREDQRTLRGSYDQANCFNFTNCLLISEIGEIF